MKNNYVLGIDIGIASVGYGVIDNDYNIIDAGVRLFDSANPDKNKDRRSYRQTRRLIRRKKYRLTQLDKIWIELGFNVDELKEKNYTVTDVVNIRCNGLTQKITIEELYKIMYSMLKHRGITHMDDELLLEEDSNGKSSKKSDYQLRLEQNKLESSKKYPCEIQKEKLDSISKFRGDTNLVDGEDEIISSNIYSRSAYIKEIERILDTQSKYHDFVSEEFIEAYKKIFNQKRAYYEGPGDPMNRTDYGRFRENGETWDNIFAILVGKCSIYTDEYRASASSYTAQLFNLLNDLNNLTIGEQKINIEEKLEVIEELKQIKTASYSGEKTLQLIAKICKVDANNIKGYRIDEKEKPIFHTFETYRLFRNKLNEAEIGIVIEDIDIDTYDQIANIMTINTESEIIIKQLNDLINDENYKTDFMNDDFINFIVELTIKNHSSFNRWHSFSLKLMNEIIPIMLEEAVEQQTIITRLGLKTKKDIFKEYNRIPSKLITDEIYNPVVAKSVSQSIGVINALTKKYGEFASIVIELPREDSNEKSIQKNKDMQKYAKNLEKNIDDELKNKYNIVLKPSDYADNKKLGLKLKLWYQQGGRCLYSGKDIDPNNLINTKNGNLYEIDHIIPRSISFDDSQANKVLVERNENSKKGNSTPYMYLSRKTGGYTYNDYKNYILKLKKEGRINKSKMYNLLFEGDITKQDVLKGFIARNLNDTRYSSRVVLNSLQDYTSAHEMDTKVKVVNGSFTNQFRKQLDIKKDRNVFSHHGVDALICAYSNLGFDKYAMKRKNDGVIDVETGEILDYEKYQNELKYKSLEDIYVESMFSNNMRQIAGRIDEAEKNMKFSYKVDKKVNRKVYRHDTTYSTRSIDGVDYVIEKFNLYGEKSYSTYLNNKDNLLIKKHDPKTFEKLEMIEEQYAVDSEGKKVKNPFLYYKELEGCVTKYTKKGNGGAEIHKLKYIKEKLGKHEDVTHKYENVSTTKKVVKMQMSNFRVDIYYNENKQKYIIVPIEYRHFKYEKGKRNSYVLEKQKYEQLKKNAGVDDNCNFLFSLYTDDRIQMVYNGQEYDVRYSNVHSPTQLGLKAYNRNGFIDKIILDKNGDIKNEAQAKSINQMKDIKKVNTDILGNKHIIQKEKLILHFDL